MFTIFRGLTVIQANALNPFSPFFQLIDTAGTFYMFFLQ